MNSKLVLRLLLLIPLPSFLLINTCHAQELTILEIDSSRVQNLRAVTVSQLSWQTQDPGLLMERYIWGRWLINMEGDQLSQNGFKFRPHMGINKFRLRSVVAEGDTILLVLLEINPKMGNPDEVRLVARKVKKELGFTKAVNWEIYDSFGKLLLKGHGQTIDLKDQKHKHLFPAGPYYVTFDNKTEKFIIY